jgi:predicted membrane protein
MKKDIGFKIIIIIFSLTVVAQANAAGFIFNWQPFVVNADLALKSPRREVFINNLPVADIDIPVNGDSRDMFSLTPDQNNDSTPKTEKKSAPGNIKVILSQASTFIPSRNETLANSDDEQVSKIINAMTSLIYGDSKIKSLETIGKIIEPQINFYFEF